jgi:hypothetical protein
MSKQIDNRVVQLELDNDDFESNAKQSIKTLDELEKSLQLESGTEGLEKVQNAGRKFNLDGVTTAIQGAIGHFSALEIAGITAVSNLTNKAVDAGERLVKSLTIDQVTAGWGKYEQKTASVQTLVNSTGKSVDEINGYLDRLMWYSDETSYSFTEMTAALAQMTSAGGNIDKLLPMIMGIANATAYAGKGAREFQSTIRNLGQSYQAGHLQLMDMKSLNIMGTSSKQLKETFIAVGEAMGKIQKGEVTLENFDNSLAKKWADTEVMEAALGKFSELSEAAYKAVDAGEYKTAADAIEALAGNYDELAVRAFKSAQEAKSFSEAIEATKDAVSSGWLATFESIFGNYEESKVMWTELANELYDVFASGAEYRNKVLEEWKEFGGRENLINSIKDIYNGIKSFVKPIHDAWEAIFPKYTKDTLLNLTNSLRKFSMKFRSYFEVIEEAADEGKKAIEKVISPLAKTQEKLDELAAKVIGGEYGNGQERADKLREEGYSYELVQNKVNELLGASFRYEIAEEDIAEATAASTEANKDNAQSTSDKLRAMQDFSRDEKKTQKKTKTRMENLQSTFKGLFAAIDIVKMALEAAGEALATVWGSAWTNVIDPLIGKFLELSGGVGEYVTQIRDSMKENNTFKKYFEPLGTTVAGWIETASKKFGEFWTAMENSEAIAHLGESLGSLLEVIIELGGELLGDFGEGLSKLAENLGLSMPSTDDMTSWIDIVAESIAGFIDKVVNHKEDIKNFFGIFTDTVVKHVTDIASGLSTLFQTAKDFNFKPIETINTFFTNISETFSKFDFSKMFTDFGTSVGDATSKIGEGIQSIDMDKIMERLKQFGGGVILFQIIRVLEKFVNSFGNITKIPATIGGVLSEVQNTLIAYQTNLNAGNIKKVAEAIAILAGSIFLLSFVDDAALDKSTAAIVTVILAMTLLVGAYTSLKKLSALSITSKEVLKPFVEFLQGVKDALSKGIKIAAFGVLATGIGIGIVLLIKAVSALTEFDWDKVAGKVGIAMFVITILMTLLTVAASFYATASKNDVSIGGALSFITIAASMLILVEAIKSILSVMETIKGDNPLGTLWSIVGMISVLLVAMGLASRLGKGKGNMGFAVAAILLSVAVNLFVMAMKSMLELDVGQIILSAGTLIIIIGLMAGLIAGFAILSANGVNVVTGIYAIQQMAIALAIFAGALALVGSFAPQIQAALGPLLLIMVTLGLLTALVSLTGAGESLLAMSYSLAALGIGMLAVAAAAYVLGAALPKIVDGLIYLGEASKEHGEALAEGFKIMAIIIIAAFVAGLIASKSKIIEAVVSFIDGFVNKWLVWMQNSTPKILFSIFALIVAVLAFLNTVMPDVVDYVVQFIVTFMHSVAKVLREQAPAIFDAIIDILDAIWDMLVEFVALIVEKIPLGKGLADWLRGAKDIISNDAEDLGDNIMKKFEQKYGDTNEKIRAETRETEHTVETGYTNMGGAMNDFDDNLANHASSVTNSSNLIGDSLNGINIDPTNLDQLTTYFSGDFLQNNDLSSELGEAWTGNTDAINSAYSAGTEQTIQISEDMAENTEKPVINLSQRMPQHGANIALGLAEGVSSNADEAVKAVAGLVDRMNAKWAELQMEHSPSRVWFDFGKFLMIGLANGVKKFTDTAVLATTNSGSSMNLAMTNSMMQLQETMNSNLDFAPTIRPVMDSSGIVSGAGMINDIFAANQNASLYVGNIMTKDMRVAQQINDTMDARIGELKGLMKMQYEKEMDFRVEVPVNIDGRETARVIAPYARNELNRLDRNENRRNGRV